MRSKALAVLFCVCAITATAAGVATATGHTALSTMRTRTTTQAITRLQATLYPRSMFYKRHGLHYLRSNALRNSRVLSPGACNQHVYELKIIAGPPFQWGHGEEAGGAWSHCWGLDMKWMESQLILYEKAKAGNVVAEAKSRLDTHSFCTQCKRDFTIYNTTFHKCYTGPPNRRWWLAREFLEYNNSSLPFGSHYMNAYHWALGCKAF